MTWRRNQRTRLYVPNFVEFSVKLEWTKRVRPNTVESVRSAARHW